LSDFVQDALRGPVDLDPLQEAEVGQRSHRSTFPEVRHRCEPVRFQLGNDVPSSSAILCRMDAISSFRLAD